MRCWPREAKDARSRPSSSNARSSRCGTDERRAVPELLLGGLAKTASKRVPGRLAGLGRRVGDVDEAQGALAGGDLGVRRGERLGELGEQPVARVEDRGAGLAAAGRPRTAAGRGSPAPRGWRAAGGCAGSGPGRRRRGPRRRPGSAGRRARRAPSAAASAHRPPGASPPGAKTTTRSTPGRAAARRGDAVDADPLAPAGRPVAHERHVHVRGAGLPRCGARRPGRRAPPSGSSRRRFPVRWEAPRASSTMASRRLVLPAAFGPQTRCGPASNDASSAA